MASGAPAGFPPVPPEPEWVDFTRPPVIEKIEDKGEYIDYLVTDQFVERFLQHDDYAKRIKGWKKKHLLP